MSGSICRVYPAACRLALRKPAVLCLEQPSQRKEERSCGSAPWDALTSPFPSRSRFFPCTRMVTPAGQGGAVPTPVMLGTRHCHLAMAEDAALTAPDAQHHSPLQVPHQSQAPAGDFLPCFSPYFGLSQTYLLPRELVGPRPGRICWLWDEQGCTCRSRWPFPGCLPGSGLLPLLCTHAPSQSLQTKT